MLISLDKHEIDKCPSYLDCLRTGLNELITNSNIFDECEIHDLSLNIKYYGVVIYPMAVYASRDIGLVYPMARYTTSLLMYPNFNHFFLRSFMTRPLTLSKCNNNQVILLFHGANPC